MIWFTMSIMCFGLAAGIDMPFPGPSPAAKNVGNFLCSLGFVFLAIGLRVVLK
jgi:hypothetical protein